jgi:hypothetical protein
MSYVQDIGDSAKNGRFRDGFNNRLTQSFLLVFDVPKPVPKSKSQKL